MPEQKPRTPLRAERLKALKDAAKDVCPGCAGYWGFMRPAVTCQQGEWVHRHKNARTQHSDCDAAAIWSRIEFEYSKEECKPE